MGLAMIRGARGLALRRYLEKLYFEMHDLQYRMGKPTIAALTGPARAAGVTLATHSTKSGRRTGEHKSNSGSPWPQSLVLSLHRK